MMTIGELAKLAGTTVRSVRYYHSNGLLEEPQRQPNGYRMYRAVDLARLSRIRRLRDLGIPVAKIAELLDGDAHDTRSALDALDKELATKAEQIAVQRAHIESLRRNADPELPDAFSEVLAQYVVAGAPTAWIDNERELLILALTVSGGRSRGLRFTPVRPSPGIGRAEPRAGHRIDNSYVCPRRRTG